MTPQDLHYFNMIAGYTLGLTVLGVLIVLKFCSIPLPERYNNIGIKSAIVLIKAGLGLGGIGMILQSIINFDLLNDRPHSFYDLPVWALKDWGLYLITIAIVLAAVWLLGSKAKKLWWVGLFVALGWGFALLVVQSPG